MTIKPGGIPEWVKTEHVLTSTHKVHLWPQKDPDIGFCGLPIGPHQYNILGMWGDIDCLLCLDAAMADDAMHDLWGKISANVKKMAFMQFMHTAEKWRK